MNLEEYQARLQEIKAVPTALLEYRQKVAEFQAEYLAEQAVPNAEVAAKFICDAQERGELPELESPTSPEKWSCELKTVFEDESPHKRWWRCQAGWCILDVCTENGELALVSV